MHTFEFEDHQLSEIFKGNWQLAGGHGNITPQEAMDTLIAYAQHGVNVFDVGDIYTGAEQMTGDFLKLYKEQFGEEACSKLRVHTKFVPDLNALEDLTEQDVRAIVERSIERLGADKLNLVQFHWWDFNKGDYIQAAKYLDQLRQEGLIESIGLTNFDTEHTQALLDAGIPIRSNQIQFSLLDPRPFNGMLQLAQKNNIAIFCYGTLAGGLLANSRPGEEPTNRSHIKYGLMIDEAGEAYYQAILAKVHELADKYETTVGNIATRFVLQTPGVSSAILGARNNKHINELDELADLRLNDEDYAALASMMQEALGTVTDDIYSYERDVSGPHGRIMKYNLNGMRPDRD